MDLRHWQKWSTFNPHQQFTFIIATLLLTVHLRTISGHQASSSSSTNIRHQDQFPNTSTTSSTTLSVATAFLGQLEHYQRETHYGIVRSLLDKIEPALINTEADRQCLLALRFALRHPLGARWTAKLLDSNGALFPVGLFSGTYTSFGDFDTCLAVEGDFIREDNESHLPIRGQHCFATLRLPADIPRAIDYSFAGLIPRSNESWPEVLAKRWSEVDVRFPVAHSLCLPDVCSADFVAAVIRNAYEPLKNLDFGVAYCQTKDTVQRQPFQWPAALIFACTVLGTVSFLVGAGTTLDIFWTSRKDSQTNVISSTESPQPSFPTCLLNCFSLVRNGGDLFSLEQPNSKTQKYQWLDGIRCLLTLIALVSHVSVNQSVLQLSRLAPFAHFPEDYVRQSPSLLNRILVNSTFGIKVYFIISGFLLTVNFLQRRRLHSLARYALVRWVRFTPTLLGYVTFSLVLGFLGSGPLFHPALIDPYIRPCLQSLWMQLLYVNNLFDFRYSCGFQTWYVSADMQLHLLAYLVLYLLYRQQWRLANATAIFFIALAYAVSFVLFASGYQGIPFFLSVIFPQLPIADRGFLVYWTATYNHLEAYFCGILLGIVVAKKRYLKVSESVIRHSWNVGFLVLAIIPLLFPWFYQPSDQKSLLELYDNHSWWVALFMVAFHLSFILITAWLFYCAATYASTALQSNHFMRFLCSPFFAPFSRLCFCVYLVHVPLTWFNVHSTRYPQVRDEYGATQFVIMTYANSLFAAMFLHLFFEAPFAKVSRLLFARYDSCRRRQLNRRKEEETKKVNSNGKGGGESEKAMEVMTLAKLISTTT